MPHTDEIEIAIDDEIPRREPIGSYKSGYQTESDTEPEYEIADSHEQTTGQEITHSQLALFVWFIVFHIGHDAYAALVSILQSTWFRPEELPMTLKGLKAKRRQLPLQKIYQIPVKINVDQVASDGKKEAPFYFFSVREMIERDLLNPQIVSKCHFGSGIDASHIYGCWHGKLWKESILASINLYGDMITDPYIYAGSCMFIDIPTGILPVRIVELYQKEKEFESGSKQVWAKVNPVIIRHEDVEFFGIGTQAQKTRYAN
ncbi:MAG: hypothetical protein ACE3JU_11505 [Paenibacillus sp.]|uniref:hypothetical protein n=1 Tax=Paenibacillus sp. TaxID=58172 RepID=UPI003B81EB95